MSSIRWIHGLIGAAALSALAPALASADEPAQQYRVEVQRVQQAVQPKVTEYQKQPKVTEYQLQPAVTQFKQGVESIKFKTIAPLSKYWIGVGCESAGDALKAQLRIEYGVLVESVSEGEPAGKAGIRLHDVLQRFGEQELHSVEDLVAAVDKSEGKETGVVLIRAGKQLKVDVVPKQRPVASLPADTRVRVWNLRDGLRVDAANPRVVTVQPGILLKNAGRDLPDGLKVTITKTGSSPAEITVEKGENKWTVSEDKLDDLPESVRDDVKRFLGKLPLTGGLGMPGMGGMPGSGTEFQLRVTDHPVVQLRVAEPKAGEPVPTLRMRSLQINEGVLRQELEETVKRLESLRDRLRGDDTLEQIRDELKALRRDVDELRKERNDD